ncbi:centrosomal protein CCDC61-like [Athalia rosae]|uniref:centrosomal protein CCDC61-like n=1 Tax=Athalia rosae TaxID=37344 RepID=UPI0020339A2D|nr:centrosomal protein CCDC61-like [Athalia rosae]
MNDLDANLVTTNVCNGGREYVVKMRVSRARGGLCRRSLELIVTDKQTAEDWQSSYDTAYIENLTQKTGNFKQFDVFVAMLQSALLKTSDSVTIDLLTFEDLEVLRSQRTQGCDRREVLTGKTSNRRYLIVTYSVEFDRIHYPLPLEYCGPPDVAVLQLTIKRLMSELEKCRSGHSNIKDLHKRVERLTLDNKRLVAEKRRVPNGDKGIKRLLEAVRSLENAVTEERALFRARIQKLRVENATLMSKLRDLNKSACRKPRGSSPTSFPLQSRRSVCRRRRSRSASSCTRSKHASLSSAGTTPAASMKSADSPCSRASRYRQLDAREVDFGNLESRIHTLQRMLKDGINLN